MSRRLLLRVVPALAAAGASGQSLVEPFDGGSNAGGWTYGVPCEQVLVAGGNPGAHLDQDCLDTFAPRLRTSGSSGFTGDWRARDVAHFGVDLITKHVNFAFEREMTVMLTDGTSVVYYLSGKQIPQVGAGWRAFDVPIDAQSPTLPDGWSVLVGSGDDDADWNAVIQDVTEVSVFYGDPTFFYIFDQWFCGVDNPRLSESLGTVYCSSNPNSTGVNGQTVVSGDPAASTDLVFLSATDLPASQFGYFLASRTQGFVANPGGSMGNLCLAGNVARFRSQATTSGTQGTFTIRVDTTSVPTSPPSAILAGETWSFQAWHRDVGSTSNLTDATSFTFQ